MCQARTSGLLMLPAGFGLVPTTVTAGAIIALPETITERAHRVDKTGRVTCESDFQPETPRIPWTAPTSLWAVARRAQLRRSRHILPNRGPPARGNFACPRFPQRARVLARIRPNSVAGRLGWLPADWATCPLPPGGVTGP